jgi:hypothetical protein
MKCLLAEMKKPAARKKPSPANRTANSLRAYRDSDPEKRRAYMRELTRKKRAMQAKTAS